MAEGVLEGVPKRRGEEDRSYINESCQNSDHTRGYVC